MAQTQTGPPLPTFQPPHPLRPIAPRRIARSGSSGSLAFTQNAALHHLAGQGSHIRSSRTWTTSSGDLGLLSDTDEVEERTIFVQEYNRLAKKHGVRILVVEDFEPHPQGDAIRNPEKRSWFHRMLRSTSNNLPPAAKLPARPPPRHKRSVSDLAHNLVHSRREPPKVMNVQDMIRLSGKSALYLPQEYSPCSLILPTCLRATAQFLAQNVTTRGLFRIPGSARVVNALYDYYCYMDNDGGDIANTVRCVNLPIHIPSSVHDVASTFKRLLSALPGGILGSLSIFDAFVAIHSHLHGDPEFPRTKQTKVRARLIALAIGTIKSQFRRELICAVLGLLSLIGRVAEVSPREDDDGRPLPTGDLMGYHALGIVFGPLLVGDLLENYVMTLVTPTSGLLVFPHTPQKLRRGRRKSKGAESPSGPPTVDKILVAISITEMLISNWRDVVRQMKTLGTHNRRNASRPQISNSSLRPSNSESFVINKPGDWDKPRTIWKRGPSDREGSPEPATPTLGVKRQRPKSKKSAGSFRSTQKPSFNLLSPTAEENLVHDDALEPQETTHLEHRAHSPFLPDVGSTVPGLLHKYDDIGADWESLKLQTGPPEMDDTLTCSQTAVNQETTELRSPHVFLDDIPPRMSSKQTKYQTPCAGPAWISSSEEKSSDISPSIERGEFLKVGGVQRSRWPNKKTTHNGLAAGTGIRSNETPRKSIAVEAQSNPPLNQLQHASSSVSSKTRNSFLSPQETSVEPIAADMTLEPAEEASYFWMQGNTGGSQKRPQESTTKEKSGASLSSRVHSHNSSHPNSQQHQGPQMLESTEGESINATPRYFYSPMRVPPSLVGYSDIETDNSQRRPTHASGRVDDGRKPSQEELVEAANRIARQSKTSASAQPCLDYTEPPSTKPWMAQPRIVEAQNRIAAQPKNEDNSVLRPSVSAVAGRQGAVKAIAARFEGQEPSSGTSTEQSEKRTSRTQSLATQYTQRSASKPLRGSKSGPPWTPHAQSRASWASQKQLPRTSSSTSLSKRSSGTAHTMQPSAGDSVSSRAAAIMDSEKQQTSIQSAKPHPPNQKTYASPKKPEGEYSFQDQRMKSPPSLGTMVPYPEQPPVAHHLSLPRPNSSSSLRPPEEDFAQLIPRPGSTSVLHAQIRSFQRQLDAKIEEVAQLRRQVEAQDNSDIGTLSEQLREAKREVVTWRERAEAAERRVKVFERFTARLRGIREAAVAVDQESGERDDGEWLSRHGAKNEDEVGPHQHVKAQGRRVAKRSAEEDSGDDTGRTEDAGVITARIRKSLHSAGKGDSNGVADSQSSSADDVLGIDGANSPRGVRSRDISHSAVEIWIAAQELLYLDGESVHGADGFF